MDKLTAMQVFSCVAEQGNYAAAAHQFNISRTMVSKHINQLEGYLGVKLINRTTRQQALSESGLLYYQECKTILAAITAAENTLQTMTGTVSGIIKINAPVSFGNAVLAPIVNRFLLQYPQVDVDLRLDNNLIDPLLDNVDVLVRIGELEDSALIGRHIMNYDMQFCASPQYLDTHPDICSNTDLSDHQCLGFSYSTNGSLSVAHQQIFGKRHFRLSSNSGVVLTQAAIDGLGVVLQPSIVLKEAIEAGLLVSIASLTPPETMPIHLLYKDKNLPLKTRSLIEFIVAQLADH
ncbi:LysR family transcriptional regulator [Shewanella livingstonensis]|uniref:LysR family transcriptional regulator n=1 Tax=Shewanella livingstonensis TaxID=150120 RepID=A0A3G8LTX2_9GAMM|nr:LysR family transcriptional regulator [Shewanella livingstonensis]AZG73021.1 LysR family transcriptional regulator [Shewanella livingstonensis]